MTPADPFQDNLKAYLDGELSWLSRRNLRRHLNTCPDCRKELDEMELIRKRLRDTESNPNPLSPELKAKLVSGLPEGVPPTESDPARPSRKTKLVFGVLGTAVLGAMVYPLLAPRPSEDNVMMVAENKAASNMHQLATAERMYSQDYAGEETQTRSAALPAPAMSAPPTVRERALAVDKPKAYSWSTDGTAEARKTSEGAVSQDRQVHREAVLDVQVDNAETKSDTVETMTKTEGGFVAQSGLETNDDGTRTASLTLKIPVEKFEPFLVSLGKLGTVKSKSISGEDLTEQISDEKSGRRTLEAEVEELKAQLIRRNLSRSQERQNREDLRDLKSRIAIKTSRLEMYHKMANLSTLTLTLSEKSKKQAVSPPHSGFRSGFDGLFSVAGGAFVAAAKVPFFLLIWFAAYSPLWLPLVLGYRYYSRRA